MQCQARTCRSIYDVNNTKAGGQCSRTATYVDDHNNYWCKQHAKDYPTIYRKSTGKIRANCKPIAQAKGESK